MYVVLETAMMLMLQTVMLNILLYMVIMVKNKLIKLYSGGHCVFHPCGADHDHGDHDCWWCRSYNQSNISCCAYFYSPGIVKNKIYVVLFKRGFPK